LSGVGCESRTQVVGIVDELYFLCAGHKAAGIEAAAFANTFRRNRTWSDYAVRTLLCCYAGTFEMRRHTGFPLLVASWLSPTHQLNDYNDGETGSHERRQPHG
jgi:hypothetical protein